MVEVVKGEGWLFGGDSMLVIEMKQLGEPT